MKDFFKLQISIKLLVLGALLRLLVAPFLFHPDIKTFYFQSHFLKQGVFNIYTYLVDNKDNLTLKEEFVYFPLTYLFFGGYQVISAPVFGTDFDGWLWDASASMIENVKVYKYLFLMKLPYLILDVLMAFILASFFENEERKKKIATLWLFNPFTITLIYIFSNIDIIPALLTTVSLLLVYKKKPILSSLLLGVAAGFKLYPLLFLPFVLLKSKNIKEGIGVLFAPLIFLILLITPFWSKAFQTSALTSGLTMRIVQGGVSLGFGESLYPAVIGIFILYFISLIIKKIPLENLFLLTLLILFSFIHFHIQWLLWAAPFAVIVWIKRPNLRTILLIVTLLAFSIPLMYNDKFMTASLFTPISNLFSLVPSPFAIIQKFFDPYVIQGVLHSALAGASLVFGWNLLKKDE